jgi:hypothetical protein
MSRSKARIFTTKETTDFRRLRDVLVKKRDFYRVQAKLTRSKKDKTIFIAIDRALTGTIEEALTGKANKRKRFENLFKEETTWSNNSSSK